MAHVSQNLQRPTLVLAPNKTLAAQLCSEFRDYFPSNAVEYFVSYYDYYQPEAYLPVTDTFIEKDSSVNEEIDRLRAAQPAENNTYYIDCNSEAVISIVLAVSFSPLPYQRYLS